MPRFLPFVVICAWTLFLFTASAWRGTAQAQGGHDPSRWHSPAAGHEHGDPPPAWLEGFLATEPYSQYWSVGYSGPFNTSAAENGHKHFAFKGLHLTYPTFKDRDGGWLDGYVIGHISGTSVDRMAMNHSFRLFIADKGGGLTIRQGWVNTGDPTTSRIPKRCQAGLAGGPDCASYGDPNQRPIWLTITPDDLAGTYSGGRRESFEQMYGFGLGMAWGWGLNTPTTFTPGEKVDAYDHTLWHPVGGRAYGQLRLIEVSGTKIPFSGAYWSTPTGEPVANPAAADCNGPCLLQYYSPTYAGLGVVDTATNSVMNNRVQKEYPVPADVRLPN